VSVRLPGQILGTPGGSLAGAKFAANANVARVGADGERKTAVILNALASQPGGPSVLHDLDIPNPKYSANVDHVIVSGKTVTIIDTKVWAGNFYWTLAGKTFRGLTRFATLDRAGNTTYPAEKRTLPLARDAYAAYLGVPVSSIRLGLIIWPAGKKPLNLLFFRGPGSPTSVNGQGLTAARAGRLFGSRPADPHLLLSLAKLVK
jgi:hypothetical protein